MSQEDTLKELADEHILELLMGVIRESHPHIETDEVARALFFFLLRVSNTWRSIRTLDKHTSDDEGPMLDIGALLRMMFDAYLQAEYISCDQKKAVERAKDYLDFEHVERYRLDQKVTNCDNPFAEALESSPHRQACKKRLQQECDRVKDRYLVQKRRSDGTTRHGPRTRTTWYSGSLADIARDSGKSDEYDILLATFHSYVHSTAFAVRRGPMMPRKHILGWASTIAARVARLSVEHNHIELNGVHGQILESFCRPFFD